MIWRVERAKKKHYLRNLVYIPVHVLDEFFKNRIVIKYKGRKIITLV
jgi:hypothetical protein